MKAQTITTMNRRRRAARRRVIALVLAVCALAIPATASAQPIDGPHPWVYPATIGASDSAGSGGAGSNSPATTGDGFDSASAAVGAGAAIALVALGGAVLFTVRRRPGVSPSASTS
jgi:hypothetical protein